MRPHELVARMLKDRDLSTYAAAKAMHKASFQPTLHKFLAGDVAAPEHSTAERICNFLALPLEAVYDSKVATRIALEKGYVKAGSYAPPAPTNALGASEPVPISSYQPGRPAGLPAAISERIAMLSKAQLEGLAQIVVVYLDQVAPLQTGSDKRQRV